MTVEPFNPDLFVGRKALLSKIERWADQPNPPRRLWSVVGPPGVGKSWLLAMARNRLKAKAGRIIFWADLSRDPTSPETQEHLPDLATLEGQQHWLRQVVVQAQEYCSIAIRYFDPTIPPEAILDALVDDLCGSCQPMLAPILLVDGFEEVSDEVRADFEAKILRRFLGRGCTRLIIARRDEYALSNQFLRLNEHREWLGGLEDQEGTEQIRRRDAMLTPPLPNLAALMTSIPHYEWNHPHINSTLFQYSTNRPGDKLDSNNLKACLEEIILPEKLAQSEFELLVILAHLGATPDSDTPPLDFWTDLDLAKWTGRRPDDPDLVRLFLLGLVLPAPERFLFARKVADGIRELIRAWKKLVQHQH